MEGQKESAGMRVLVVEDEEAIASAIERGLLKEGYAVDKAVDGQEAIERTIEYVLFQQPNPLVTWPTKSTCDYVF